MAKKGKRELIFEFDGLKVDLVNLKKMIEMELKANGVKYGDDSTMYFKIAEKTVYCVINDTNTIKVELCK